MERFARPLTLVVSPTRRLRVTPQELGSAAYVGKAVKRARSARAYANIPLEVSVPRSRLRHAVAPSVVSCDASPSTRA